MYYKLYAQTQQGSWEKVSTNDSLEKLRQGIKKLELTGYFAYMIVRNNNQGDEVIISLKIPNDPYFMINVFISMY